MTFKRCLMRLLRQWRTQSVFEPNGSYICCIKLEECKRDGVIVPNRMSNVYKVIPVGSLVDGSFVGKTVLLDPSAHSIPFYDDGVDHTIVDVRFVVGIIS